MAKAVKFRSTNLRKLPLIRFRKMKRQRDHGQAHHPLFGCPDSCPSCPCEPTMDVDPRMKGVQRLETILHEALHLVLPTLSEEPVRKAARYQAMVAYHLGYSADEDEHIENYGV